MDSYFRWWEAEWFKEWERLAGNGKPEEGMVFARLWQALLAVTLESQWISALL